MGSLKLHKNKNDIWYWHKKSSITNGIVKVEVEKIQKSNKGVIKVDNLMFKFII